MPPIFHKRIYTSKQFFMDIAFLVSRLPSIVSAYLSKRVPWPMAEKIMLAVTAVNKCRHCARFHGALAHLSGVDIEEIAQLLRQKIGKNTGDYERPALLFAQEYAQTERHPSAENCAELKRIYGDSIARDIMLYIRLIMLGNLSGNTFDAFVARLSGKRVPYSHLYDEIIVSVLAAPFLAMINIFAILYRHRVTIG